MLLFLSLLINLYLYLEYSFLLKKIKFLSLNHILLKKNSISLLYFAEKPPVIGFQQLDNPTVLLITTITLIFILAAVSANKVEILKSNTEIVNISIKIDKIQDVNISNFENILKNLSFLQTTNNTQSVNELLFRQTNIIEKLDYLIKGPAAGFSANSSAVELFNIYSEILIK